jgi:hypothetical protein
LSIGLEGGAVYEFKDSGKREDFETGARRDARENKGRYDLIPYEPIRRLAVVLEKGAAKYGDRNWEKGIPLSRIMDSMERHQQQVKEGFEDEDHEGHLLANVVFYMATKDWIRRGLLPKELDDLPKRPRAADPGGEGQQRMVPPATPLSKDDPAWCDDCGGRCHLDDPFRKGK